MDAGEGEDREDIAMGAMVIDSGQRGMMVLLKYLLKPS